MGNISQRKREIVYKRDGFVCTKCGQANNLTIDHIIPVSKGGRGIKENLQTMCKPCNVKKGSDIAIYTKHKECMFYINKYLSKKELFVKINIPVSMKKVIKGGFTIEPEGREGVLILRDI